MTTKTNDVATLFPFPVLTPIATHDAIPNYTSLTIAQRELTANAFAIRTADGTGAHGHIVLVTEPANFLVITNNVAHPAPVNPGAAVPGAAALYRQWEYDTKNYQTYLDTDLALKQQLIAALPNLYIKALEDNIFGYAQVTTLAIMTHLWTTYGTIQPADLDFNIDRMNKAWHPPTPIEDLFAQLDAAIKFATDNNDPISENTAVRAGYTIISKTGLFETACYHWRQLPLAGQTLAAFKTYFTKANSDRETTAAQAGYHANRTMLTLGDFTKDSSTPTKSNLSSSQRTTTTATSDLTSLTNQFELLLAALAKQTTSNSRTAPASNRSTSTTERHRGYCWTHGITHSVKVHTSANCKNKAAGHQDTATETHTMGGSDKVWTAKQKPTSA